MPRVIAVSTYCLVVSFKEPNFTGDKSDVMEMYFSSLCPALGWRNTEFSFYIQWKENSGRKGQGIFFLLHSAEIILKEVKSVSGSTVG